MSEVWRPIPSLPQYIASSEGRVMRVPYRSAMPHGSDRVYGGEPTHGVLTEGRYSINFKGRNYRVHRLVCEAFAGTAPFPGAEVMHLNEKSTDNRSGNLAWGTHKENMAAPGFRAYLKRRKAGPKITPDQARMIKYGTTSARKVAAAYGISASTVSNIRCGRAWKHI